MKTVLKLLKIAAIPVVILALALALSTATARMDTRKAELDKENLEQALNRAAVACYAIEGAYPPSIEYLEDHYRVRIDKDRYTVKYELYASNLMPDITVLENE